MTLLLDEPRPLGVSETRIYDAGVIHCGYPQPNAQEFREHIKLDDILVTDHEATFFLRASGTSMVDDGIDDGDVVLVNRTMLPQTGDDVVAFIDGEFTLKRLTSRHGQPVLAAMSPRHPDITVNEWSDVMILGVVTYVIKRKCRRVRTG